MNGVNQVITFAIQQGYYPCSNNRLLHLAGVILGYCACSNTWLLPLQYYYVITFAVIPVYYLGSDAMILP